MKLFILTLSSLALALSGCQPGEGKHESANGAKPEQAKDRASRDSKSKSTPLALAANAPSIDECRGFANKLIAALRTKNTDYSAFFDANAYAKRVFKGVTVHEDVPGKIEQGVSQGLKNGGWIFAEVRKFIDNRGNVSLLRVREVQGRRSVLFRCVDRSGGFNHIEYLLESRPGNRIVAVDSSSLPIGELLSLHQRRQFVELARHSASNLVDGFTDTGSLFFKNFLTSVRMIGLALAGNCNDALKIYRDFSPEIQRMKSIQIVRIQACQSSDHEQECLAAVLDLQKSHPDAVCTHFFSYGYFLRKREFANALKSIDKVEQFVGGDSFLDTVRSEVHLASGNLDDAETLANRAKKSVPDVFAVHWQCLKVAIRKKDYNAAILTMKQLDKRFRCKWDDLKDIPEFTEFTRSSKYKEWQEYLRKRMK